MSDIPRYTALLAACRAVSETIDLVDAIRETMSGALKLTGAERGFITLYNKTTQGYDARAAHNIEADLLKERTAAADAAIQSKQAMLFADDAHEMLSSLTIPMQVHGKTLGAIYVDRPSFVGVFTHHDLAYFEVFAAHAAAVIEAKIGKADFVSIVTHELRLPMTSMKGYADLMRVGAVGPVNDQQKQFLTTIRNGVDRMNSLLANLSDISKIETGRLKVDIKTVDPAACAREAVEALKPQIEEKAQALTVNAPALPPVRVDSERLTQAVTALLSNAHRYTPANGSITLTAEAADNAIRFTVADSGIGIGPEEQGKVFTQFFRGESQVVRDQPGWGLALHLSKRLVEFFGGQIGFESEIDKGSTFWFTLPTHNSQ